MPRAIARAGAIALAGVLVLQMSASPVLAQAGVAKSIRYGTVVSIEQTVVVVKSGGSGQVGATIGAVAGYALSDGRDRWLGSLLGGVAGGAAGRAASKRKKKGWELIIKVEGGEEIAIEVPGKKKEFSEGDRVRLTTGPGGATKVTKA
jgi:outer membrane lipoprotein SlyB